MTTDHDQAAHEEEYDQKLVNLLELVWGEGYLSPGGPEEVARLLEGEELAGKSVLDIGCGTGGIDALLVQDYGAAHVTGVDVGETVIDNAVERAEDLGLLDRLTFECVEPGPLKFSDASFDVVFSKDALIHIADKRQLFAEIARVLKPGGRFVASDWLCRDATLSAEMKHYVEVEGLDFGMARPMDYHEAMQGAGLSAIEFTDRNAWYREVARREWEELSGPLYNKLIELLGQEMADREVEVWRSLVAVLDLGELRPNHMRASKPEKA